MGARRIKKGAQEAELRLGGLFADEAREPPAAPVPAPTPAPVESGSTGSGDPAVWFALEDHCHACAACVLSSASTPHPTLCPEGTRLYAAWCAVRPGPIDYVRTR